MVRTEDLMLDNWVMGRYKDEDVFFTPSSIQGFGVTTKCPPFETWDALVRPEGIEGIPVTADMLKRIGFEEHKGICPKTFYRYWDKEYRYKLDVDPGFCNSARKWSIHIDNGDCSTIGCGEFTYIHELQNLTRTITGYDLPITKDMLYGLDDDA